jgi:predicted patatin/cPLA2 family phospholipase
MAINPELEELLKELREYRADMVAKNYPYQRISDIITRWEMREFVPAAVAPSRKLDFLEEAEKEKQELNESYKESVRQANERKE